MSHEESSDGRRATGSIQQDTASSRLVFGLSSRTNRLRHDEYAERRMRQPRASGYLNSRIDARDIEEAPATSNKSATSKTTSKKQQEKLNNKTTVREDHVARKLERDASENASDPMRAANNDRLTSHRQLLNNGTKPEEIPASSPITTTTASTTTTTTTTTTTATTTTSTMKEPEVVTRKRFNIPPPPMKSLKSPGKSSVVNYAKSKIYADRGDTGGAASRNSILDSGVVPDSILSGFKPPKQVDVSKACERWEGGEPFAKCKSRQRLQQAKDSKWIQLRDASASFSSSITATSSLVALQRYQMQQQHHQALNGSPSSSGQQDNGTGPLKVLSRGSVLERAQKFEKAPVVSTPVAATTSSQPPELQDSQVTSVNEQTNLKEDPPLKKLHSPPSTNRPLGPTSVALVPLRRHSIGLLGSAGNSSSTIPRFYHPNGKPNTYELELQKRNIVNCFSKLPDRSAQLTNHLARRHFQAIAVVCGLSEYWKEPLLLYVKHQLTSSNLLHSGTGNNKRQPPASATTAAGGGLVRAASIENSTLERTNRQTQISCEQFLICWRNMVSSATDDAARFVHLLTLGQRNYLLPDDFVPLLQSIIDDHPGLVFLRGAPDFHMRYIQTVIARIYFSVNRSWTGKISLAELRASNLLEVIRRLSLEQDINKITDYFSYEHFYVIYCKFWCLDQDHDLLISKEDLARHNDSAISARIIERIFQGIVSKQIQKTGKMSYSDFVWFLIAEEDKRQVRSIEYWFRLMDIDGDGYISMYEMEYFYGEQMKRLEAMNIEALPYIDSVCQILDLVNPKESNKISLSDLKRTQMAPIFFDTFINIEKYLEHESREFVSSRDVMVGGRVVSDWERYASEEYESLVSEESSV